MEWTVARCDRPPPVDSSTRAAQGCTQWTYGGTAIDCSGGVMEPLIWCPAPREMRWPLTPQPALPHCLHRAWVFPCVDTDRRLAVIRFMAHIDCAHYSAIPHARCNGFAF